MYMQIHLLLRRAAVFLRAVAPAAFFCAASLHAQEPSTQNAEAEVAILAPEPIGLESNFGNVEPAASVQPQIISPANDRLFFLLPNYGTVENTNQFTPISTKTKFELTVKTMSDPMTVSLLGVIALIGQAKNSDPWCGQGFQGYTKRYGTEFADSGIGTLMTTSVFPTLLHQDHRYFQMGKGGAWRRMKYSLSQMIFTRTDSGGVQFNYSEIVGNAVAAGISNTYRPASQRTLRNTLGVWGGDMLLNSLCNLAKEFWPDIRRKIRKSDQL
jgi:hypothetical protein